jgi:cytochrome bo3 quinol oxidase subunit 3 (EC 1.10.3.-)
MSEPKIAPALEAEHQAHTYQKTYFGFWTYLMTDLMLFATLFATYAVLHDNTWGGPTAGEIFSMPYVLVETMLLLTSSFTVGLAMLAIRSGKRALALSWFIITFLLGAGFLGMELYEFNKLVHEGLAWHANAFMSSFFTLVGTHGAHIAVGLLWMIVMMVRLAQKGITPNDVRRLTLLGLFWHFLDIVWIFIFTFVYLMGAANV